MVGQQGAEHGVGQNVAEHPRVRGVCYKRAARKAPAVYLEALLGRQACLLPFDGQNRHRRIGRD